jgi:hypothetical protein
MNSRHMDMHHREGRDSEGCREITKLVLWDVIGWCAALAVLFAAMGLFE